MKKVLFAIIASIFTIFTPALMAQTASLTVESVLRAVQERKLALVMRDKIAEELQQEANERNYGTPVEAVPAIEESDLIVWPGGLPCFPEDGSIQTVTDVIVALQAAETELQALQNRYVNEDATSGKLVPIEADWQSYFYTEGPFRKFDFPTIPRVTEQNWRAVLKLLAARVDSLRHLRWPVSVQKFIAGHSGGIIKPGLSDLNGQLSLISPAKLEVSEDAWGSPGGGYADTEVYEDGDFPAFRWTLRSGFAKAVPMNPESDPDFYGYLDTMVEFPIGAKTKPVPDAAVDVQGAPGLKGNVSLWKHVISDNDTAMERNLSAAYPVAFPLDHATRFLEQSMEQEPLAWRWDVEPPPEGSSGESEFGVFGEWFGLPDWGEAVHPGWQQCDEDVHLALQTAMRSNIEYFSIELMAAYRYKSAWSTEHRWEMYDGSGFTPMVSEEAVEALGHCIYSPAFTEFLPGGAAYAEYVASAPGSVEMRPSSTAPVRVHLGRGLASDHHHAWLGSRMDGFGSASFSGASSDFELVYDVDAASYQDAPVAPVGAGQGTFDYDPEFTLTPTEISQSKWSSYTEYLEWWHLPRLRQVKGGDVLVQIDYASSYFKTLKFYWISQVGAKSGNLYSVTGAPFKTVVIKNPTGPQSGAGLPTAVNRLVVIEDDKAFHEISESIQDLDPADDEITWVIKHGNSEGGSDITQTVVTIHRPDEESVVSWSSTTVEGGLTTEVDLSCQAGFTPSDVDTPIVRSSSVQIGSEERNATWTWDMNTGNAWNPMTWKPVSVACSGSSSWDLDGTTTSFDGKGIIATEQRRVFGNLHEVSHGWAGNTRTSTSKLDTSAYRVEETTYSANFLQVDTTVGGATWQATFDGPAGATPWMLKTLVAPGGYRESFDFTRSLGSTVVRHRSGWGTNHSAGTETWTTTNRYGGLITQTIATSEGLMLETITGSNHTAWGAPEDVAYMTGGQRSMSYHETGHAWGSVASATDVYGRTTTISNYDWRGRPVSITGTFDTYTPDYTDPLKAKVTSAGGDSATDTFTGFGRLVKSETTAGPNTTLNLGAGGPSLTVDSRVTPLQMSATGEILGRDSGLGSRGSAEAWSVEQNMLCRTTTLKTQNNGAHQEIKEFSDAQGRVVKRERLGAQGSLGTEEWSYSADGLSVTYTPGPGPVDKPITKSVTADGATISIREAGLEVLKYQRQVSGGVITWVTQVLDDSGESGSQWVTSGTWTVNPASRVSTYTPWDLSDATVTQTVAALGATSTIVTEAGGDTLTTTLTQGRPTQVSGTVGGIPVALGTFDYQHTRLASVSGSVGGRSVGLGWDADGRLASLSGPGFAKSIIHGGGAGYEVTVTDAQQGTTVTRTASAVGDPTGISGDGIQPLSASTVDLANGRTQTTWNGWLSATFGPDGSLKEKNYDGDTLDESLLYNSEDLPVSYGPSGQYHTVSYTADSRTTSAGGQSVTEEFYRVGLRKSVSGPSDSREFTYLRGALAGEAHLGGPWSGVALAYAQDNMGRVGGIGIAGVGGYSVGYGYNAHSWITAVSAGVGGASYSYSASGEWSGGSQGGLSVTVGRDAIGRMTSHSVTGAPGLNHTFTYDQRHRITSREAAIGTDWYDLDYDNANRLLSVNLGNGTTLNYSYDARGNRLAGGGAAVAYTVNANNQMTSRTVGAAGLGYGVSGRVAVGAQVRVFHPGAPPEGESLTVDPVTGVYQGWWPAPGGSVTRVEMLVRGTLAGAGDNGSDAVADKKVWIALPLSSETYVYDSAGRLAEDGTWTYTWDGWGNLKTLTRKADTSADPNVQSEVIGYTYDSDQRRTGRTRTVTYQTGSPLTEESKFLWEGWHPVLEERSVNGSALPKRKFVWGRDVSGSVGGAGGIGGLVSIMEEGGRVLLPVHDGLGNIIAVVNQANGDVVARYGYGPYGESIEESGEVSACPFRYQSKWWDAAAGLSYFGYRHYSPKMGRWLSRDPLGEAGGFNLYAYCGNDPVNKWDYLGMYEIVPNSLQIAPVLTDVGLVFKASVELTRSWSIPAPVASGMYNPSWSPVVHHETVRVPVNLGIHSRLILAKGGGPMALYWAEKVFLQSAQSMVDGLHGDELVSGIETANDVLSILPGWQVGESLSNGQWWAAPIYLGRDLFLWGPNTGVKFIQAGTKISSRVYRGAGVGMVQGFTAGAVETGVDRTTAWLGGYTYEGSWRSDGLKVLRSTSLGTLGGSIAGRLFRITPRAPREFALIPLNENLGHISDDALVHFSRNAYSTIKPGAGGEVFALRFGDIKHLTPRQVESVIGPGAAGGEKGGARVMHILDESLGNGLKSPGAAVYEIPEYIFTKEIPTVEAFIVQ